LAESTTYNIAGIREDLTDFLTILEPEDTPKLSMFNKSPRPTSYYQEWQVDNLFPPNFSGVLEGVDASTFDNAAENRARIGNYVQKFWRKWAVSDIVEAADVAGISNEVANAKMKKLREIKRDIEAAIGSDNEMQADNGSVPYLFRGLGMWIGGTQTVHAVPTAYVTPTNSLNNTATASLTETNFNTVFQSIYEQNGGKRAYTLTAGSNLKKYISLFQRVTGASGTTQTYQVVQAAEQHEIDLHVDLYNGDFHTVTIVPDLFNGLLSQSQGASGTVGTSFPHSNQSRARGYVIDPDLVGIGYMIGLNNQELPDQGAGRRGLIKTVLTLMVKNPKGLGKFYASS
jgi:hypothetical protein